MAPGKKAESLLRDLRRQQGRSLRAAADDLGLAPSQLSRMERGERGVVGSTARRLSDYYDVSIELIDLAHGRLPQDVVDILTQHPEEIERLRKQFAR